MERVTARPLLQGVGGKREALACWDHVCPGYVPDVLERDPLGNGKWHLFEFKCYSPHSVNGASGARGGAIGVAAGVPLATSGTPSASESTSLVELLGCCVGMADTSPGIDRIPHLSRLGEFLGEFLAEPCRACA